MADNHQLESIVLGGGCFWCLDAAYKLVNGVTSVVQGYAGGTSPNPTSEQVYSGSTGHAEVVPKTTIKTMHSIGQTTAKLSSIQNCRNYAKNSPGT